MKMLKPVVYGYFDDVPNKERLYTGKDSKVQQHQRDQCDMRMIMKNFLKTGEITHINNRSMKFLDTTQATDYDRSLQILLDAEEAFYQLHVDVREKFHNDPREMMQFMNDPSNLDEAIKLGLAKRRKADIAEDSSKGHSETTSVSPVGEQGGGSPTSAA